MRPQVGCGWLYIRDCIDRAPLPNREPCRSNAELLRSVARGSSGAWLRGSPKNAGGEARIVLLACLGFVAAAIEMGCVHSQAPPVWGYYDQCAAENPSFLAMAECGRQKRMAECVANNTCSAEGTVFMEYVDSLALSVKNKKMTEAEAMRRYTEYKSGGVSACTQAGGAAKC